MMYDLARTERQHRALANNNGPVFSLIRKRCACGKATTARQLGQYGSCVTCVRSATARSTETSIKEEK